MLPQLAAITLVFLVQVTICNQLCTLDWFYNQKATGEDHQPKDIPQLINETTISFAHGNVPIICEGVLKFPQLQNLSFNNMTLDELSPGAFALTPKLTKLEISYNKIREIKHGVFNDLPLQYLVLKSNQLAKIHRRAFDNMTSLLYLNLADNKLVKINKNWFFGCSSLTSLDFANNGVRLVPRRAFQHLNKNRRVSVILRNNTVRRVSESFAGFSSEKDILPTYNHVFGVLLDYNNLDCVPYSLLDSCYHVGLIENPLSDECKERLYLYVHYIKNISLVYY